MDSAQKTWVVRDREDPDGGSDVIFCPTRGKAKTLWMEGLDYGDCWFVNLRVRRAPQFDRFAPQGTVPLLNLLEDGWEFRCESCGVLVGKDGNPFINGDSGTPAFVGDDLVLCGECNGKMPDAL